MGLSISFRGTLKDMARLDDLVRDVTAMAADFGWKTHVWEQRVSGIAIAPPQENLIEDVVRGVILNPPDTESLVLTFLSSGELAMLTEIPEQLLRNPAPDTSYYLQHDWMWAKTTGALESHKRICQVLDRVKQHYIPDLEVEDETGYWQSRSESELRLGHQQMGALLDLLSRPTLLSKLAPDVFPEGEQITPLDPTLRLGPPAEPKKPKSVQ